MYILNSYTAVKRIATQYRSCCNTQAMWIDFT